MTLSGSKLAASLIRVLAIASPAICAIAAVYAINLYLNSDRASFIADIVADRASMTSQQVLAAFNGMDDAELAEPCDADSVSKMRAIALRSSYLHGVAYLQNNRIICSSFGADHGPIEAGVPDYISSVNSAIRRNRQLSLSPGTAVLLSTSTKGVTAIIHPDLIFSLTEAHKSHSLGVAGYSTKVNVLMEGTFAVDWQNFPPISPDQVSGTAFHDGHLVAWHRPAKWDLVTYAAIPVGSIRDSFLALLAWILPVALLGSGLVAHVLKRLETARASLPALLRTGLKRGELFMVYQPIVDMRSGRWVGAEALVRWRRPNGELVPPDIFIPIAEKDGLMQQLTSFVVTRSLAEFGPLMLKNDGDLFLSLNFSSADLASPGTIELLSRTTAQTGLAPHRIHIELTEREQVSADEEIAAIKALRKTGFLVGTDDFGAGYSNLAYLDQMDLDFIKLDRALTQFQRLRATGTEIVEYVVKLAQSRGLDLIAEGIETEDQRQALLARDVVLGQGWLFHRAMPFADFMEQVERQNRARNGDQDVPEAKRA